MDARSVKILEPNTWPNVDDVELNQSQLEAIQAALTKEFVVIQGPPGTGKTYVGLKIVQALFKNQQYWHKQMRARSPMLVVCYTNHALDQFLEGECCGALVWSRYGLTCVTCEFCVINVRLIWFF